MGVVTFLGSDGTEAVSCRYKRENVHDSRRLAVCASELLCCVEMGVRRLPLLSSKGRYRPAQGLVNIRSDECRRVCGDYQEASPVTFLPVERFSSRSVIRYWFRAFVDVVSVLVNQSIST